jgi:hypothetical protein
MIGLWMSYIMTPMLLKEWLNYMAKTAKSGVGKGHERREEDFAAIQRNWDEIPNFGYKPKWMRELESCGCDETGKMPDCKIHSNNSINLPADEKLRRYPAHLQEFAKAISDLPFPDNFHTSWNDDTEIMFCNIKWDKKEASKLKKLLKKYNMDSLDLRGKTMYIWEVVEKMHDFRPF